jgi:hypothetical protein
MKDSQLAYDMMAANPASLASRREHGKQFFLISLLLATWLPIALFLSLPKAELPYGLETVKFIFLFLGTAHVPATIFFYMDRGFAEIIRKHKGRYIYLPILVTVLSGLIFAFLSTAAQAYLLLIYWGWQAFHYGRQNIGVYAFASIAQTGRSPRRAEKLAIDMGTLCGIFGTFKILGMAVAPAYLHGIFNYLYLLGSLGFVGVLIFTIVVYVKYFSETTALKTLFLFTSVFFFFPVFISTDLNVAFLSYAMAHGFQYLVFMTTVSLNSGERDSKLLRLGNALKPLALVIIIGFAFSRVGWAKDLEAIKSSAVFMRSVDFLVGAIFGLTMAHFLIDAGAWKLSMELQRNYITRRFKFLFGQPAASGRDRPEGASQNQGRGAKTA